MRGKVQEKIGCLGLSWVFWVVWARLCLFGLLLWVVWGCFEMLEVGFGWLGLLCRKTGSVSGCLRVFGVLGVGQLLVRAWAGGCLGGLGALI